MGYENLYDVQQPPASTPGSIAGTDSAPMILYLSLEKHSCQPLREHLADTGMPMIESQSIYHVQQELVSKRYAICVVRCREVSDTEFEFLQFVKNNNLPTRVIVSAETGTIDLAVRLMKSGAVDFVVSEAPDERLASAIIQQSTKKEESRTAPRPKREADPSLSGQYPLVGQSRVIHDLRATVQLVTKSKAPVLITGESGTGKEIVARQVHHFSDRRNKPFVALNCAALPSNIIENELFGHEKGAFSGAIAKKAGCFELADGGTLFLDEVAEMDLENQAKLLRVLEQRAFRRLGGKDEITVDVKVVAASNKNIVEAIDNGEFREDLYYRLSVIEIEIPPLRERKEDIVPLASYFLNDLGVKYEKELQHFSEECMNVLMAYHWPGNVRELRNVVERAVVMCQHDEIEVDHIPGRIKSQVAMYEADNVVQGPQMVAAAPRNGMTAPAQGNGMVPASQGYDIPPGQNAGSAMPGANGANGNGGIHIPMGSSTQDAERIMILQTLASVSYNKSQAARILGVSRKTLHNKINALFPEGIEAAAAAHAPSKPVAQAV